MKVVCVRLIDFRGRDAEHRGGATLDSEYVVLEILADPDSNVLLRIMDDYGDTPALFQSEMFMTVSAKIPTNWVAVIGDGGRLTVAPSAWQRPGFWDDYFDGDLMAKADFERERALILNEESEVDAS